MTYSIFFYELTFHVFGPEDNFLYPKKLAAMAISNKGVVILK